MPTWRYSGFGSSLLSFLFSTVSFLPHAHAQAVGTVGSVNQDARGTPPGKPASPLEIGRDIFRNERLQTDTNGTAHIIFADRSALNVGRNSNVVVDSFVYSGDSGVGRQTLSLAQGVVRFVGGQISHVSQTDIKTPAATIGVRGGNVTAMHHRSGDVVMVHNGQATVTTRVGSRSLPTGYQITINPDGTFGELRRIDLQALREATALLASSGAQTGGARHRPTNAGAGQRGVGNQRAPTWTPNFDLPTAGDNQARGKANTINQGGSIRVPVYRP
jgi:hypothetical protein